MSPILLALALFLQVQPAAADAAGAPAPEAQSGADAPPAETVPTQTDGWPAGAPRDDYQLVAWCYGALRGWLELHDQVMPEVTRIETTFHPPGRKLADDLKVYADMQKAAKASLKQFQAAITAAEKASLRPINTAGAAAVAKGRAVWQGGPEVTKARLAQEWMSWALPARCETTAKELEQRATLLGASFKANAQPEPPLSPAAEAPATDPGKLLTEAPPAAPADAPAPEPKPN